MKSDASTNRGSLASMAPSSGLASILQIATHSEAAARSPVASRRSTTG